MAREGDNHEDVLHSRWKKWGDVHTTLASGALDKVSLELTELQHLMKETFCPFQLIQNPVSPTLPTTQLSSRCCGAEWVETSMRCRQSPSLASVCLHCHQLLGLSAVTLLAAVLRTKKEKPCLVGDVHLTLLLEPENVRSLVSLMQHPCEFLRYQARRALVAILSLPTSSAVEAVPDVAEQCISIILSPASMLQQSIEPLQLLCSLTSKRTTGLPVNLQCIQVLKTHLAHMYSMCCMRTSLSVSVDCPGVFASSEGVQNRNRADTSVEGIKHCGGDDRLYLFLCLVQKLAKLVSGLEPPQRSSEMQFLFMSVLRQLCDDLFFVLRNDEEMPDWLVVRKRLDVIDTVLNYDLSPTLSQPNAHSDAQFLTGNRVTETPTAVKGLKSDERSVLTKLAQQVLCCVNSAQNFFWRCSLQQIFIGGQHCSWSKGPDCVEVESSTTVVPWDDSSCNPVLVLLLAVTLKSCAFCMRGASVDEDNGKEMTAMSMAAILAMHMQVSCQIPSKHTSVPVEAENSAERLDWLPQVCGDQDDRWLEALLCLLDIYVHITSLPDKEEEQTQKLLTLLDPHNLFIQLLTLTHFDSTLFLDWLTSPETCCLRYFTRYLRHLSSEFSALVRATQLWDQSFEDTGHSVDVNNAACSSHCGTSFQCRSQSDNASATSSVSRSTTVGDSCSSVLRERNCGRLNEHGKLVDKASAQMSFLISPNSSEARELAGKTEQPETCSEDSDSSLTPFCSQRPLRSCAEGAVSKRRLTLLCSHHPPCNCAEGGVSKKGLAEMVASPGLSLLSGYSSSDDSSDDVCSSDGDDSKNDGSDNDIDNDSDDTDDSANMQNAADNRDFSLTSHPAQKSRLHRLQQHQRGGITLACSTLSCMDRVMCLLQEVREKLERLYSRGLMAYNPRPLVALLYLCEELFDSSM